MAVFILSVIVMAIAVLIFAVRIFLVKDGEVRGGCAGKNPLLNEEGVACGLCGAKPGEECKEDDVAISSN